jgi:hypothetical protein
MGGVLVDCPTGKRFVPEFNSVIAFRIPRFHEVEAVKADRPRYSIFGWFLSEELLYDLNTKAEVDENAKPEQVLEFLEEAKERFDASKTVPESSDQVFASESESNQDLNYKLECEKLKLELEKSKRDVLDREDKIMELQIELDYLKAQNG